MNTVTLSKLKAKHPLLFKPKTLQMFGVQKKKIYKSDLLGCSVYCEKMKKKLSNNVIKVNYSARKIKEDLSFGPVEHFDRLSQLETYIGKNLTGLE